MRRTYAGWAVVVWALWAGEAAAQECPRPDPVDTAYLLEAAQHDDVVAGVLERVAQSCESEPTAPPCVHARQACARVWGEARSKNHDESRLHEEMERSWIGQRYTPQNPSLRAPSEAVECGASRETLLRLSEARTKEARNHRAVVAEYARWLTWARDLALQCEQRRTQASAEQREQDRQAALAAVQAEELRRAEVAKRTAEEETARRRAEAEFKQRTEEERRRREEAEARRRADEDARRRAEEEARRRGDEQRRKEEATLKQRTEEDQRKIKEEEVRRRAETDARRREEEEARRREEEEARRRTEAEARRQDEEQRRRDEIAQRRRQEEDAKRQTQSEAKRREEEERRRKEEADRRRREEEEQRRRDDAEAKRRQEQLQREREELAKKRAEEEARRKEEARLAAEHRAKKDAVEAKRREMERQAQAREAKLQEAVEAKRRAEEDRRAKAEADRQAKREAEKEAARQRQEAWRKKIDADRRNFELSEQDRQRAFAQERAQFEQAEEERRRKFEGQLEQLRQNEERERAKAEREIRQLQIEASRLERTRTELMVGAAGGLYTLTGQSTPEAGKAGGVGFLARQAFWGQMPGRGLQSGLELAAEAQYLTRLADGAPMQLGRAVPSVRAWFGRVGVGAVADYRWMSSRLGASEPARSGDGLALGATASLAAVDNWTGRLVAHLRYTPLLSGGGDQLSLLVDASLGWFYLTVEGMNLRTAADVNGPQDGWLLNAGAGARLRW
jgi:hypothetical protein